MEVSLFSLLAWAFVTLGGFSGILVLLIQVGKLAGWWSSAPPFVVLLQESLADGKITAEEAAKLLELLAKMQSKE